MHRVDSLNRSGATRLRAAFLGAVAVAIFAVSTPADDAELPRARDGAGGDVISQEIDVTLAEIEVVVTDRQGDPVAGLTREDFRVFQDGHEVELTHFQAAGGGPASDDRPAAGDGPASAADAAAPESPPAAVDPDRQLHLVIYVDRSYLEPRDLYDVRPALRDFLRHSLALRDRVMLVAAGPSLELLHRFTSVPELVILKLDDLQARPGGGRLAREYQTLLTEMRRIKNQGSGLMGRDPGRQGELFVSRIQAFAAELDVEIERTISQLRQLTQRLAGLPGRRAVLYIGGRVPTAHARRLFDTWEDTFGRLSSLQLTDSRDSGDNPDDPGATGSGFGGDTRARLGLDSLATLSASFDVDARRAVEEAAADASRHGVTFHTLEAGGPRDPSSLGAGDVTLAARGSTGNPGVAMGAGSLAGVPPLRALARGTGGRAFAGGRDFAGALARVGSDLATYYSLGFAPRAASGGGSRLEVKLTESDGRDGLEVRHRAWLALKDRDTLAIERTISALLLEEMDNPLAVELSAGEPAAADKEWRVPVSVTVPLAKLALVADGRVHAGRLSIFSVSGNLDRIGSVAKAVVPVRINNQDLLTSLGRRASYRLELTLASSRGRPLGQRIAVTVRDDFRPQSSTAVTIPPAGTDTPARPELDSR